MIAFRTETNSVYEVDSSACRMRRLVGTHAPTPNQGADGVWRNYGLISAIEVGEPVLVIWEIGEDCTIRSTLTTDVVETTGW